MEEVEEVRRGRPETLDPLAVEGEHEVEQAALVGRVQAPVEEVGEGPLVLVVLVDVGDAELRLPVEGVGGPLEHLLLLGHRLQHRFERRPLVVIPERAAADRPHHLLDAAADRPERLQPVPVVEEPGVVNRLGVLAVAVGESIEVGQVHSPQVTLTSWCVGRISSTLDRRHRKGMLTSEYPPCHRQGSLSRRFPFNRHRPKSPPIRTDHGLQPLTPVVPEPFP